MLDPSTVALIQWTQASALQGARHRGTGLAHLMGQWDGHHGAHCGWTQDQSSDRWEPAAHPTQRKHWSRGVQRVPAQPSA